MKRNWWIICDECRKRIKNLRTNIVIKLEFMDLDIEHFCNNLCFTEFNKNKDKKDEN